MFENSFRTLYVTSAITVCDFGCHVAPTLMSQFIFVCMFFWHVKMLHDTQGKHDMRVISQWKSQM